MELKWDQEPTQKDFRGNCERTINKPVKNMDGSDVSNRMKLEMI